MLCLRYIRARIETEYGIRRLLVIDGDHLQFGAVGSGKREARNIGEADLGRAGLDGLNRLRGALRGDDRNVEPLFLVVALRDCRVPRRMAAKRNEIEREHDFCQCRRRALRRRLIRQRARDADGAEKCCDH